MSSSYTDHWNNHLGRIAILRMFRNLSIQLLQYQPGQIVRVYIDPPSWNIFPWYEEDPSAFDLTAFVDDKINTE